MMQYNWVYCYATVLNVSKTLTVTDCRATCELYLSRCRLWRELSVWRPSMQKTMAFPYMYTRCLLCKLHHIFCYCLSLIKQDTYKAGVQQKIIYFVLTDRHKPIAIDRASVWKRKLCEQVSIYDKNSIRNFTQSYYIIGWNLKNLAARIKIR